MFFHAGFTIHSRRTPPGQAADRAQERQQVRVQVVRLGDVAGDLDRRPPVRERDDIAARDLAAEPRQVLGRQLQRGQELDQRDVVDRVGRQGMIVGGQALEQLASRVDVRVDFQQGLVGQLVALVGRFLDELPGVAVERAEGLGRLPIERGEDRVAGLASIGPRGSRTGCPARPRPSSRCPGPASPAPRARASPAPCRRGWGRPAAGRAPSIATASAGSRLAIPLAHRTFRRYRHVLAQPRNLAWNRASHASTTDLTAPSTSSPVSVRSGWRKTMPKWTLCVSVGEIPALERVQVVDGFERRPRRADDRLGQSAQGKSRATTSERSRTTAGNGGRGRCRATSSACSQ